MRAPIACIPMPRSRLAQDGKAAELGAALEEPKTASIMSQWMPVELLNWTAGSKLGVLMTARFLISRLRSTIVDGKRPLLFVGDLGVTDRLRALIHSTTAWQDDEGLKLLLHRKTPDAERDVRYQQLRKSLQQLLQDQQVKSEDPFTQLDLLDTIREALESGGDEAAVYLPVTEGAEREEGDEDGQDAARMRV